MTCWLSVSETKNLQHGAFSSRFTQIWQFQEILIRRCQRCVRLASFCKNVDNCSCAMQGQCLHASISCTAFVKVLCIQRADSACVQLCWVMPNYSAGTQLDGSNGSTNSADRILWHRLLSCDGSCGVLLAIQHWPHLVYRQLHKVYEPLGDEALPDC